MNRLFLLLACTLISFVVYGFYISQFEFSLIPNKKNDPQTIPLFYDYKLSLNIYTNISSGSGNPTTIAQEANRARLNFIMLSDNDLAESVEPDRYLYNVGVLRAFKLEENNYNYIVYSPNIKNISSATGSVLNNSDDYLIIANHPLSKNFDESEINRRKIDGLEVINFKSVIQKSWKNSKLSTIWSLLYYPFNPRLALMRLYREPIEELELFDRLSQKRKISFICGAEATARAVPFANWFVKFPSYESSFDIASQHILLESELTGDINQDKLKIYQALKNQQSYVAFDALGNSNGFIAYAIQKNKKYFFGDDLKFDSKTTIYYKLPSEPTAFYEVVLFKNGTRLDHLNTFEGLFKINSPGVYRLQVRLSPRFPLPDAIKWITWIYTNNFYITE
ncbi:MAG: hypothetical protein ACK4VO_00955 [Pseudobdellovibrio sp.]